MACHVNLVPQSMTTASTRPKASSPPAACSISNPLSSSHSQSSLLSTFSRSRHHRTLPPLRSRRAMAATGVRCGSKAEPLRIMISGAPASGKGTQCELITKKERKLFLVPVPVIIGVVIAEVLRLAALDVSPLLKDAEVPWHLFVMAVLFTLLKLPGPYYPFWGRIIIPHIANGGLLWTLVCAIMRYRRPRKASTSSSRHSESGSHPNEL